MHPFVLYFIKVVICSGILLGYYWVALRNKVFHHYNRFYLLAAVVLSLLLPIIHIDVWQQEQAAHPVIHLLQVAESTGGESEPLVFPTATPGITLAQVTWWMYMLACTAMLALVVKSLVSIFWLYKRHEKQTAQGIQLIQTEAKGTPFSFFQFIFWNRHIDLQTATGQQILKHEIAHVRQRHSLDKIFLNTLLIPFWCNPFFWLIRKELNMIHEFMADKIALENQDSSDFAAMILQAAYPQHRFDISNPFFYSPIKRRLMMLTKNTHTKAGYFSRLMVLPLTALVFVAFTFKTKPAVAQAPVNKPIIVVVDAGHGGQDFGAKGGDVYEKDIALQIAKKIKELNTDPNLQIILSRETDVYQTPPEKVTFINEQKADFAVSVHVDAEQEGKKEPRSGMFFWVSKDYPNSAASKVLASTLIQSIDKRYPFPVSESPAQRKVGTWILKASKCPTVLVEVGFMTHKKNVEYLKSPEGIEETARNLLNGIVRYAAEKETLVTPLETGKVNPTVSIKKETPTAVERVQGQAINPPAPTSEPNKLVIIDGKIIGHFNDPDFRTKMTAHGKDMQINANQINILDPADARAKYGAAGAEGAIEIQNKSTGQADAAPRKITDVPSTSDALIVVNGKSIGTAKDLEQRYKGKFAYSDIKADINYLEPKDAVAKYGKTAAAGAYEINDYSINATLDKPHQPGVVDPLFAEKNAPLYVIDGTINPSKNALQQLPPSSIDKIDVLKGAAAITKYGEAGKNGVIEITTKQDQQVKLPAITKATEQQKAAIISNELEKTTNNNRRALLN